MAYRGTREQLEARKGALLAEVDAIDEKLRLKASYLESRRRERWGLLGALWSRLATRAPRRVRIGRGDGSVAALERDVDALTRALVARREELSERLGLVQQYDDDLAARVASEASRTRSAGRVGAGVAAPVLGTLMVIGQVVRVLFVPLLVILAVLGVIGAVADGDSDMDFDFDGLGDVEPSPNPHEDRIADAVIGGGTLLVLGAGGGALWWWLG
jgi:hypothetical protein